MMRIEIALALALLDGEAGEMAEVRVHMFADDEEAHDDARIESLYAEFNIEFDRVKTSLIERFGTRLWAGIDDDDSVPLNGVFRFALWDAGDRTPYIAAVHEDRGCPIVLILGTTAAEAGSRGRD